MITSTQHCPDLEALFTGISDGDKAICEHAFSCPDCSVVLEEHRQMEKDLFRLVDPLPPPDFTAQVMAKVATAPAPIATEVRAGVGILLVAVSLFLTFLFSGGRSMADLGATLAQALVQAHATLVALATGLQAVWGTAAVPFVAISLALIVASLLGLRRLTAAPQSA